MTKALKLPDYTTADRLILANARQPIEKISELTGIPAELCAERLEYLLATPDHLTDRMEERLLLLEMSSLVNTAREKMNNVGEDNWADVANVALRGYDSQAKRLDERRRANEMEIDKITQAQAWRMIEVLRIAMEAAGNEITELYPEFDPMDINRAVAKALPAAREQVKEHILEA